MNRKTARTFGLAIVVAVPLIFLLVFRPLGDHRKEVELPEEQMVIQGEDTTYLTVPYFSFETHLGDTLSSDDLLGQYYIAEFIFTHCPGICPVMNTNMMDVQSSFISDTDVKIVSFSVDQVRDTIETLRDYAAQHGAVPGKWYFVRGEFEKMKELAESGFKVTLKAMDDGGFDHSEKFILVSENGNIINYYDGTDSVEVNQLMKDLVLMQHKKESR